MRCLQVPWLLWLQDQKSQFPLNFVEKSTNTYNTAAVLWHVVSTTMKCVGASYHAHLHVTHVRVVLAKLPRFLYGHALKMQRA